jgi:hypothetical protein
MQARSLIAILYSYIETHPRDGFLFGINFGYALVKKARLLICKPVQTGRVSDCRLQNQSRTARIVTSNSM